MDYSINYQPVDLDARSHQSSQPKATSRDQGQSQQQRNSSQSNREQVKQVKPSPSASSSQPLDRLNLSEKSFKVQEKGNIIDSFTPHSTQKNGENRERIRLNQDEVNQIVLTARSAIKRYGSQRNEKTVFDNSYYQIEKFSVFETYGYRSYLTIDAHDGRGRLLTMKGQNFHPANLKVIENHLTKQDVLTFEKIQSGLDCLQQIRQFKDNVETILLKYNKQNRLNPFYGTIEGEKYRIERNEQILRVTAKDGRGEIFSCPGDLDTRNPETQAVSNLNREDVELFSKAVEQIKQRQREAKIRLDKEQSQRQERSRGIER